MNCVKCGRPLEHSGHSCDWENNYALSIYGNEKAIDILVQKLRLYDDMIEVIKLAIDWWSYQTGSDFKELAQSTLDRAEKLK
jgi:hypothetical protein